MPDISNVVRLVAEKIGADIRDNDYDGFLSKVIDPASSLAIEGTSHQAHIAVTGIHADMLLFPVVTSSAYESGPIPGEKRRYYLKASARLFRENLLALLRSRADDPPEGMRYDSDFFRGEIDRVQQAGGDWIDSWTHVTFQLRGSGQRQLEVGLVNEDGPDFTALRRCLRPGDVLVFLKTAPAGYDVFGLRQEELAEDDELAGSAPPTRHRQVVSGIEVRTDEREATRGTAEAGRQLGIATERKIAEVLRACERYGHRAIIALAGVPGTGKTFMASIVAHQVTGDPGSVRQVQFHPAYTYEEFIEGLRLDQGGVVARPGVFLEWNDRALQSPEEPHVLIIEELTRANLSAVLGELMTFVEYRERSFLTPYSRRQVHVAPNLLILATYNPLDRSAIEIDDALLRRLRIIQFPPSAAQLGEMLGSSELSPEAIEKLKTLFREGLTASEKLGLPMPFGHGVFAHVREERPDLFDLWEERLQHMLGKTRPLSEPHGLTEIIERNFPWTDPEAIVTSSISDGLEAPDSAPEEDQSNPNSNNYVE